MSKLAFKIKKLLNLEPTADPTVLVTDPSEGDVAYDSTAKTLKIYNGVAWAAASGDVVGPAGATADAIVKFDGVTGKLVKVAAGSETSGAWTWGSPSDTPYSAGYHTTSRSIFAQTPTTANDSDGGIRISANTYHASGAPNRKTSVGGGGLGLFPRTADTLSSIIFYTNLAADGATATATASGQVTQAGAWTLGPSSGLTTSHLIQASPTNDYALKVRNIDTSANAAGLKIRCGGAPGAGVSSQTVLNCSNSADSADYFNVKADGSCNWFNNNNVLNGSKTGAGAWTLGPTPSTSLVHTINIGNSGLSRTDAAQAGGSFEFAANGGDVWLTGKTTTDNTSGVILRAMTKNTNSSADMRFVVSEDDFTDYSTTTTQAFRWSRFSTELGSCTRAGAWTLGTTGTTDDLQHLVQSGATGSNYVLKVLNNRSDGAGNGLLIDTSSVSGTGNYPLTVKSNGTDIGNVNEAGAWTFGPSAGADVLHTFFSSKAGTGVGDAFVTLRSTGGASNQKYLQFQHSSTTAAGGIQRNGTGTDWVAFSGSDRRIKTNITDLEPQWEKFKQLRIRRFDLKEGGCGIGVIAQELHEVYPNKVNVSDDGQGDELPEGVPPWEVQHGYVYESLAAIKELIVDAEAKEARIQQLESTLASVLARIEALEAKSS